MANLRYLSVCSGIEAATVAWHPLGWEAAAFSEIEPFPCAVLAHHYPDVPLHGDFATIKGDEYGPIDLLVGGTPCQSFSVAGLRGGLADDRGNLTLQFLKLAQRVKPTWITWENVPGVISDKTGALPAFLDGLEELGYICDIDILDAQFHGVPQKRRRVFVCGQHRDHLIAQRTDSSALTIAQCWQETLLGILADQQPASASAPGSSALASLSRDGVTRRMRLFGLDGGSANFERLRLNLVAAWRRSAAEQNIWASRLGESAKELTLAGRLTASQTDAPFILTEASLNAALAESCEVMRSFITSTTTKPITQTQIFTCSQAVLHIARLTLALNHSSPPFWSAASSSLTALKGFIDYARSTGSDLFAGVEWFHAWGDFLGQAIPLHDTFEHLGIGNFGQVLPLGHSLSGNPPPCRQKGQAAPTIPRRSSAGGGLGTDFDCDGGLVADTLTVGANQTTSFIGDVVASSGDVSHCLNGGGMGRQDFETETLIAHSLRGEGFDASEDGTGRGTPLVPVAFTTEQTPKFSENNALTLTKQSPTGGGQIQSVMQGSAVRRLTPRECERLQGFSPGYTAVPYRGKPAADGPRYKALGNSMAVPVMAWIGQRIQMVEAIAVERLAA